jgi:hypothetical protein
VRGQDVDAFVVIADLRGPKLPDLLGMLGRIQHAPTIDAQLAPGQRNRSQFHAHAIKLGDESFNVKIRHFFRPNPGLEMDSTRLQRISFLWNHSVVSSPALSGRSSNPRGAAECGSSAFADDDTAELVAQVWLHFTGIRSRVIPAKLVPTQTRGENPVFRSIAVATGSPLGDGAGTSFASE